jgi:hypothetical protein
LANQADTIFSPKVEDVFFCDAFLKTAYFKKSKNFPTLLSVFLFFSNLEWKILGKKITMSLGLALNALITAGSTAKPTDLNSGRVTSAASAKASNWAENGGVNAL